jgi:hypothetical protein
MRKPVFPMVLVALFVGAGTGPIEACKTSVHPFTGSTS